MNRLLKACVLSLTLVLGMGGSADAEPRVLRITGSMAEQSLDAVLLKNVFAKTLEDSGRWKVECYFNSGLGNSSTCVEGLMLGIVQIFMDSVGNMSQFAPDLGVLDTPYVVDLKNYDRLRTSSVWQTLLDSGSRSGLKFIGILPNITRNMISRGPLKTADDFLGKKNRCTTSSMHIKMNASLGLKPTPMPTSEVLTGLQQGVIDSMDGSLFSMLDYRWVDVAKYITLTSHSVIFEPVAVSRDWWDELPQEDQELIITAYDNYEEVYLKSYEAAVQKSIATMQDMGCDVFVLPDEEIAKLKLRAASIINELSPRERELYQQFRVVQN